MASVKQIQSNFLNFIQAYKNVFNTTYANLQSQPNLPPQSIQSIQQKQFLIQNMYQNYRQVIQSIDALQEIDTLQVLKNRDTEKSKEEEESQNSMGYVGNQASFSNLGQLTKEEQKYKDYENQICERHDKAVERYRKAIKTADIWRENLYKYINANLPSGNH